MILNLSKDAKVTRIMNGVVAGTSDQTSAVLDMDGFESVEFIALFGALSTGAVTSIKLQQGALADMSDAADLEGTKLSIAESDDDKVLITELIKPKERYLQVVVDRGTGNAVIDGIIAIQHGARVLPVTHASSVAGSELHSSPSEGTA